MRNLYKLQIELVHIVIVYFVNLLIVTTYCGIIMRHSVYFNIAEICVAFMYQQFSKYLMLTKIASRN